MAEPAHKPCSKCQRPWDAKEFYDGCSECKVCKRKRSRDHRAIQARKVALAERLIDVLADLAARNPQLNPELAPQQPALDTAAA